MDFWSKHAMYTCVIELAFLLRFENPVAVSNCYFLFGFCSICNIYVSIYSSNHTFLNKFTVLSLLFVDEFHCLIERAVRLSELEWCNVIWFCLIHFSFLFFIDVKPLCAIIHPSSFHYFTWFANFLNILVYEM